MAMHAVHGECTTAFVAEIFLLMTMYLIFLVTNIPHRHADGQTDRLKDRGTEGQTGRPTVRQVGGLTGGRADRW